MGKNVFQVPTNAFTTHANAFSANPQPITQCKHTTLRAQSCPRNQNTGNGKTQKIDQLKGNIAGAIRNAMTLVQKPQ
jgi:hypothetical protein